LAIVGTPPGWRRSEGLPKQTQASPRSIYCTMFLRVTVSGRITASKCAAFHHFSRPTNADEQHPGQLSTHQALLRTVRATSPASDSLIVHGSRPTSGQSIMQSNRSLSSAVLPGSGCAVDFILFCAMTSCHLNVPSCLRSHYLSPSMVELNRVYSRP
jgi:hypothetical protein